MVFDLLADLQRAEHEIAILGSLPLALHERRMRNELLELLKQRPHLDLRILCESDDDLFYRSLVTDTPLAAPRVAFSTLRFRRDLVLGLKEEWGNRAGSTVGNGHRVTTAVVYVPVSAYIIRIDGSRILHAPLVPRLPTRDDYSVLASDSLAAKQANESISYYLSPQQGGRYVAAPGAEVLQLYDQDRAPRGIFPRQSFYDTDFHQFVVWDFVFDREGNLLIHQRGTNAGDNRGMWDKSVGGHVDWRKERGSAATAIRELIEELFEDELDKEAMAHFTESAKNAIHLGDWRPDKRAFRALQEIKHFRNELAFFTLPIELQTDTPRHLPDGSIRSLRVIVHIYIFIANRQFNEATLERLKNSVYRLVKPSQIKTDIQRGSFEGVEGISLPFVPTPDLRAIMAGELRNVLEVVSEMVQLTFAE